MNENLLVVEQNNYATKVVNAYIIYELETWLENTLNDFKLRNCFFGAASIIKNSDKEKWFMEFW